jgi:hypothetical protein
VTTTFVLGQNVHFAGEVGVRVMEPGLHRT